jgi:hypothetical protein
MNRGLRTVKKTEPLEKRMEKRLNGCLRNSHGRFCLDTIDWMSGDITREMFRKYLKRCVRKKALAEWKDQYGRTWYTDNGEGPAADRSARMYRNPRANRPASR